jgi:biopolymer transport protein ExbD
MPPKILFRAGSVALLLGVFLFWGIPIWLRFPDAYPWSYRELASVLLWFSVSLAGAGGLLIWRAALRLRPVRWEPVLGLRIIPDIALRSVLPWRRHRPTALITQLPNFGLIYGAVLWILLFLYMMVATPRHYYGLAIDLRTPIYGKWENSPLRKTLGVYLAAGGKYYVNGGPVSREALRERLQQELSRRMEWTVYFEADYNALNMDAIYAMDTIQGLGGKLMWITPKLRERLSIGKPIYAPPS